MGNCVDLHWVSYSYRHVSDHSRCRSRKSEFPVGEGGCGRIDPSDLPMEMLKNYSGHWGGRPGELFLNCLYRLVGNRVEKRRLPIVVGPRGKPSSSNVFITG